MAYIHRAIRHPRLLRLCVASSIYNHPPRIAPVRWFASDDDDDDDDRSAWKPPNKPLVGDIGMSHQYRHVEDAEALHELEAEMRELEMEEEDDDDDDDADDEEEEARRAFLEDSDDDGEIEFYDDSDDDQPLEALVDVTDDEEDDDDAWVRPDRQLGSIREQVQAEDVEVVQVNEADRYQQYIEKQNNPQVRNDLEVQTDWLQTRREMLKDGPKMMKPDAAARGMQAVTDLPVKHHTLLTKDDIIGIAETLGGLDIRLIRDDEENPRMGAEGFIFVTLETHTQRVTLAETLRRQLMRRHLHEVGVVGAQLGVEGDLRDPDETWLVLDCFNYVVHILDGQTRANLNLEKLWTGEDNLHSLDTNDEEAIDKYVAENPAPQGRQDVDHVWLDAIKILRKAKSTVPSPEPRPRKKGGRQAKRRF